MCHHSDARELNLSGAHQLDNRPTLQEVSDTFRAARLLANIGSLVLTVVLVLVWPAFMVLVRVMSREEFTHWVSNDDDTDDDRKNKLQFKKSMKKSLH